MPIVGEAYVDVHADVSKASDEIRKGLSRGFEGRGSAIGENFAKDFSKSFSKAFRAQGVQEVTKSMKNDFSKAGDEIGEEFSKRFASQVSRSLSSLQQSTKVKLELDDAAFGSQLATARTRMQALTNEVIRPKITMSEAEFDAAIIRVRTRMAELSALEARPKIDLDSGAVLAQILSLEARIRALGSLSARPHVELTGVDAALAQARLLESTLSSLARGTYRIKVDVDIAGTLAQLTALEAALNRIDGMNVKPKIDVDTAGSMAQIALLQAQLLALNSMNTKLKFDTGGISGAMGAIGRLGGALRSLVFPAAIVAAIPYIASLGASAVQAAAGLAVLPAALLAVGAAAGTLISGMSGLGEALKAGSKQATSAGAAAASNAAQQKASARAIAGAQRAVSDAIRDQAQVSEDSARRISDAARAVQDALQNQAKTARNGARAIADAQRSVQDAYKDAAESAANAARRVSDAQRSVQDAVKSAADTIESAQRRVIDANERLVESNKRVLRAEEGLHDARQQAIYDLEDIRERTSDNALSQEGASIALARAIERQKEVMVDAASTDLDRREAALRVAEAQDRVSDTARQTERDLTTLADAESRGVENARNMVSARETMESALKAQADAVRGVSDAYKQQADAQDSAARRISDAQRSLQDAYKAQADSATSSNRRIEDAERRLSDARESAAEANAQAARSVSDAQRNLADAQRDAARAQEDASRRVSDAQRALADAYEDAATKAAGGAGAANKYAEAMNKLSPAGRALVETLLALKPAWKDMQLDVQEHLLTGIAGKVQALSDAYLPVLRTGLVGIADGFNLMAKNAADALLAPAQIEATRIGLDNTGKATTILAGAMRPVIEAFATLGRYGSEFLPQMAQGVVNVANKFNTWIQAKAASGELTEAIRQAGHVLGQLGRIAWDLGGILNSIFNAGAASGRPFIDMVEEGTDKLNAFLKTPQGAGMLTETFRIIREVVGYVIEKFVQLWPAIEAAGRAFGPLMAAARPVVDMFMAILVPALVQVFGLLEKMAPVLGPVIGALLALKTVMMGLSIITSVIGFFKPLWTILSGLWSVISGLLVPAIQILLYTLFGITAPAWAVIAVIAAIVAAIVGCIVYWDEIKAAAAACWDAIVAAAKWAWDGIKAVFDWIGNAPENVKGLWNSFIGWLGGVWDGVTNGISVAWDSVVNFFAELPNRIIYALGWIIGKVVDIFLTTGRDALDAVTTAFNAVVTFFQELPGKILSFLQNAGTWLVETGRSILTGLRDGIVTAWNATLEFFRNLPSNIMTGLQNAGTWLMETGRSIITGLRDGVVNAWNGTITFFTELPGKIGQFFVDAYNWLLQTGEDVINGFIQGIQNAWNGFWSWIGGLIDSFIQGFKDGLGVASPSTIFMEIGGYIIEGLKQGILAAWQMIVDIFTGLASSLGQVFTNAWNGISTIATTIWNGLVTIFSTLWNGVKVVWDFLWNGISTTFTTIWTGIQIIATTIWTALTTAFSLAWQGAQIVWDTIWNAISTTFTTIWTTIQTVATTVWTAVSTFLTTGWTAISTLWTTIWTGIRDFFVGVWEWIKTTVMTVWTAISTYFSVALEAYRAMWSSIWTGIRDFFVGAWNFIRDTAINVWNAISSFLTNAFNTFVAFFRSVWDGIKNFFSTTWTFIRDTAVNLWNAISSFFTGAFNSFSAFFRSIWDAISATFSNVWNAIKNAATNIWNAISSFFTNAFNGFKNLWTTTWNSVSTLFTNIWNGIQSTAKRVWDGIIGIVRGSVNAVVDAANWMVGGVNKVLGFLRIPLVPTIPRLESGGVVGMPQLAAGGALAPISQAVQQYPVAAKGTSVGSGFETKGPQVLVGEGRRNYPEFVIPTDPQHRKRARNLASMLAEKIGAPRTSGPRADARAAPGNTGAASIPGLAPGQIPGLAGMEEGGVLGWIGGKASSLWNGVTSVASAAAGKLGDAMGWLSGSVQELVKMTSDAINSMLPANNMWAGSGGKIAGEVIPAIKKKIEAVMATMGGGPWDQVASTALAITRHPQTSLWRVLKQIQIESGGNPRAINLWDSNAKKGTPSKGLIQTIDPTFQRWRLPSLPNDPYHPLANIVAGIRYADNRYGAIENIWPKTLGYAAGGVIPRSYDSGGMLPPGQTLVQNDTGKPEMVLPGDPVSDFKDGMLDVYRRLAPELAFALKTGSQAQIKDAAKQISSSVERSKDIGTAVRGVYDSTGLTKLTADAAKEQLNKQYDSITKNITTVTDRLQYLHGNFKYTVREGDTLASIASKFGTTVKEIQAGNRGLTDKNLKVGGSIMLPSDDALAKARGDTKVTTYQAGWGDTISSIAKKFGMSLSQLQALNPNLKTGAGGAVTSGAIKVMQTVASQYGGLGGIGGGRMVESTRAGSNLVIDTDKMVGDLQKRLREAPAEFREAMKTAVPRVYNAIYTGYHDFKDALTNDSEQLTSFLRTRETAEVDKVMAGLYDNASSMDNLIKMGQQVVPGTSGSSQPKNELTIKEGAFSVVIQGNADQVTVEELRTTLETWGVSIMRQIGSES